MKSPRRVLYIQHASSLGGSCMSLLITMRGLTSNRYEPRLALAQTSPPVVRLYEGAGFQPICQFPLPLWHHSTVAARPLSRPSTWVDLWRVARNWRPGKRGTLELVDLVKPDLVHLNSMCLSASAVALKERDVPLIWHVRESPPGDFLGIRRRLIACLLTTCPDELIFLSRADRQAWVGGVRGEVLHNFVDFARFDRSLDGRPIRSKLGLAAKTPVVLYAGGLREVKGIFPLLRALVIVRRSLPDLRCLMPDGEYSPPDYWKLNMARRVLPALGTGTVGQRVARDIARLGLEDTCIRLPFARDMAPLFAASDLLVFPAIRPHFARPVIEAGAMAKPVVASRLDGMDELVDDGNSGVLVEPDRPEALAAAILSVLSDRDLATQMGDAGFEAARERFSAHVQCERIMHIYDRVLDGRRGHH